MVYTSVIYCFRKFLKFFGVISVLLHNYIWSFDVRSLLIGVQKKLEWNCKKKEFFSVDIAKKPYSKITRICYQFTPVLTKNSTLLISTPL